MNKTDLHILMLEDDPLDAELVKTQLHLLEEYNCIVQWTVNRETYLKALHAKPPDIILSDYSLPQYNGLTALNDLKDIYPLVPFIFVTGTLDEETAVGTIKAGAWDYVVKDRLFRLPLAIRSALQLKVEKMHAVIAEVKNQQLSMAIEQSPVHIIISNTENKIEYVNTKFTEVTGYTLDEIIGKNVAILSPENDADEFYQKALKENGLNDTWRGEIQSIKKDGSLFWESASISALKNENGETTHYITIKEDITGRKIMEKELIEALDKAERSDQLKDAFLQNLSHEIRTPLNAVVGFSELMNNNDLDAPPTIKHYASLIMRGSKQLLSIVSDVLTMSSIQTGQEKVNSKPVEINKLCDEVYTMYKSAAENKKLTFSLNKEKPDILIYTDTDETKLLQILGNLIDNAIKFTDYGSITMKYMVRDDKIEFHVKDSGIGITKEVQEYIFDRFRQADSTIHTRYGGTGLGLSISKSFAEMLGGKLSVESEIGEGAEFMLIIPHTSANVQATARPVLKNTLLNSKLTILVAEDEIINFYLIEAYLKSFDYKLLHARNGVETVDLLKNNPEIDLILMDIKMPVMDGVNAFKEIRKFNNNVPIIAQTAYALEKERRQFLGMGFSSYIAKPLIKEELLKLINECLITK